MANNTCKLTAKDLHIDIRLTDGEEQCAIVWGPQNVPKIYFKCAVVAHLEHNYSAPRF